MAGILPQQRLLLELLSMSGNIAVPDVDNGSLLYRTLQECKANLWITLSPFGAGFNKASITDSGRNAIKDRRKEQSDTPTVDRRRPPAS